jgi:hypothetical protein
MGDPSRFTRDGGRGACPFLGQNVKHNPWKFFWRE